MRPRSIFRPIARYAAALAIVLSGTTLATAATASPAPARIAGTVVLRYTFDRTGAVLTDESGRRHLLRLVTSNGGTTRGVAHGAGRAVVFPSACTGGTCPKAVLQTVNTADLNPGTTPIRYGASVLLRRRQTSTGENVLQKGYSASTSQYKLQVDHVAGRPSCVLVDRRSPRIHTARSAVSVSDGIWHRLECRRTGTSLTIIVDGVTRGRVWVPVGLSVANDAPLSIGGKGAYRDNDQFLGTLDDVWVARLT